MNVAIGYGTHDDRLELARRYIEEHRHRRQSNKVLHGHPSPTFWRDRDVRVGDVLDQRRLASQTFAKTLNVYVATPYCLPTDPDRCGFCLFPSEVYRGRGQLDHYLAYLEREGQMYAELLGGCAVGNVYFGGGTSNLYRPDQYRRLLEIVGRVVGPIPPTSEVTLEGIPQLFTREKLEAMKAVGVNRVSIGVQQLDDEMIKMSGRKQKAAHVFQTLDWCQNLGLAPSVDLIFGWPRQTIPHMLSDLKAIVGADVPHITHYELNVAGRTDFARNRRDELPSTAMNLVMYRVARDFLLSHGYRQLTIYDWAKRDSSAGGNCLYEETGHVPFCSSPDGRVSGVDTWGWGFAGVSLFYGTPSEPGCCYMNTPRVDEYFAALDRGEFPVGRSFRYAPKDLRLTVLWQMLHTMSIDRADYRRLFAMDPVEEHRPIWQALVERGWADIAPESVRLVGDGVFYTPLIHGLLAHDRMEELRKSRVRTELPGGVA